MLPRPPEPVSAAPQLIETTETPARLRAVFTAVTKSKVEGVFASTRTMLAPGAMAWDHSTSRAISVNQPVVPAAVG